MENKSNSRTQTSQNRLKISLVGDVEVVAPYSQVIGDSFLLETNTSYKFVFENNQIQLFGLLETIKLPATLENFKSLLALLERWNQGLHNLTLEKKEKDFFNRWKKISLPNTEGALFFSLFDELMEIFYKRFQIENLPSVILSLNALKTYQSCQILLHEKGNVTAISYDEKGVKKQVDVLVFQKIYNQVKKSKNKQFSQIASPKEELEVAGTFLARDFELHAYSMLLIVSRNEFLSPDIGELDSFEFVCAFLCYFISESLKRKRHDKRVENIRNFLQMWDEKIQVLHEDKVIFENDKEKHFSSEGECLLCDLSLGHRLKIYKTPQGSLSLDLQHHQRIALLGELLNTLQHELSNPLFGLKLSAEILSDEKDDGEMKETLKDISQHSERCQAIIKNFSNLYHDEKSFLRCDLLRLIKEAIVLTKSEIKEIQKEVVSIETECWVSTNPTWFTQIIFNALLNSGQAIKNTSQNFRTEKITIRLEVNKEKNEVCICIEDTGPGITDENLEKIFSPFFTTKKEGTGLGLSICQNLAQKLDGKVSLANNPNGRGAIFVFIHPLIAKDPE